MSIFAIWLLTGGGLVSDAMLAFPPGGRPVGSSTTKLLAKIPGSSGVNETTGISGELLHILTVVLLKCLF